MKKKILIGYLAGVGGIDKYIMNVVNALRLYDVSIDILTSVDLRDDYIKKYNVNSVIKISRLTHPIKRYKETKRIIKNNNYDIAYFNISEAFNCVCNIAFKNDIKTTIITHSHSSSNDSSSKMRRILDYHMHKLCIPILNSTSEYYYACSSLAGEWLFGNKILKNKNFRIINNTVDENKFKFSRNSRIKIRKKYDIDDNTIVIGFVGNFVYQKNIFKVLDIFKSLKNINENSKLIMLGDGELKQELLKKISENELDNYVCLPGLVNNVYDYLSAFDVFILPSRFEGMPIVGIEAQINGLVSLFSDNIAKEVDISNVCFFIDNDDTNLWVEYILNNYKKSHSDEVRYKNIVYDSNKQKREFYDIFIKNKYIDDKEN